MNKKLTQGLLLTHQPPIKKPTASESKTAARLSTSSAVAQYPAGAHAVLAAGSAAVAIPKQCQHGHQASQAASAVHQAGLTVSAADFEVGLVAVVVAASVADLEAADLVTVAALAAIVAVSVAAGASAIEAGLGIEAGLAIEVALVREVGMAANVAESGIKQTALPPLLKAHLLDHAGLAVVASALVDMAAVQVDALKKRTAMVADVATRIELAAAVMRSLYDPETHATEAAMAIGIETGIAIVTVDMVAAAMTAQEVSSASMRMTATAIRADEGIERFEPVSPDFDCQIPRDRHITHCRHNSFYFMQQPTVRW